MMIRSALTAALACLAGTAACAADRALVIGIDSYPGIKVNGVAHARDLRGATNDARRMAELIVSSFGVPPENVTLLTNADATGRAIIDDFRSELVDKTGSGDRVYLYYAGHGAQVVDDNGDETDDHLDEVLVPADAEAELAGPDPSLNGVIYDDDIGTLVSELEGRIVTVIVDSCHSGTITRGMTGSGEGYSPVRTITPLRPIGAARPAVTTRGVATLARGEKLIDPVRTRSAARPTLAVWTAVSAGQYALEDMSAGGSEGLFTSRFVRGVEGLEADLNRNGTVTPAELMSYLRKQTKIYCSSYDCLGQDPLPTLESFDGYQRQALVTGEAVGTPVAFNDAAPQADAIVRETGAEAAASAVPTDMLPADGPPVAITLSGDGRQKVGEALAITVTAPEAGRLVVLDRRENGETVQLFPNSYSRLMKVPDLVTDGQTIAIPGEDAPFELTADQPGRGVITALIIDPSVDIGELTEANQDLADIAAPGAYADKLAGAIGRAVTFTQAPDHPNEVTAKAPLLLRGDAAYQIGP